MTLVSRSHSSDAHSVVVVLLSFCSPSFLPPENHRCSDLGLPNGSLQAFRRKSCQEFQSPKMFSRPVVELLKREVEPLFLHSNFFSVCCWWRRTSSLLWVSGMCYHLTLLPHVWYVHPELPVKIRVADIKVINFAELPFSVTPFV